MANFLRYSITSLISVCTHTFSADFMRWLVNKYATPIERVGVEGYKPSFADRLRDLGGVIDFMLSVAMASHHFQPGPPVFDLPKANLDVFFNQGLVWYAVFRFSPTFFFITACHHAGLGHSSVL
jgi:hypothetical protein